MKLAHSSRYKLAFKRRRDGKTDYRARLNLIGLDKSRLVVRITNQHTIAQIINVEKMEMKHLFQHTPKNSKNWDG